MCISLDHVICKSNSYESKDSEKTGASKIAAVSSQKLPRGGSSTAAELHQKWVKIVRPQVVVCHNGVPDATLKEQEKNYNFGATVQKIKDLQAQGKSICLFVGRSPVEKLPSDYGEAGDNEVWVSADMSLCPQTKSPEIPYSKDRLHLWLDCNQPEGLALIQGLFDKIVIDGSTTKGLANDFVRRFLKLLRGLGCQMIFENPTKLSIGSTQTQFDRRRYLYSISWSTVSDRMDNYAEQHSVTSEEEEQEAHDNVMRQIDVDATQKTEEYLTTISSKVERSVKKPFPYTSTVFPGNSDYFVVTR